MCVEEVCPGETSRGNIWGKISGGKYPGENIWGKISGGKYLGENIWGKMSGGKMSGKMSGKISVDLSWRKSIFAWLLHSTCRVTLILLLD